MLAKNSNDQDSKERPSAHNRLPGLDVLRAFAVGLTYLMHFSWLYAATFFSIDVETQRRSAAQPVELQWVTTHYYSLYGVYLFFMISGLLIGRKWLGEKPQKFWPYLRDRAMRIFPAFWVALAVAAAIAATQPHAIAFNWFDVAANASLLNWFSPQTSPPWLIVSWSLQVEWIFYLAMPLVAWLLKLVSIARRTVLLWGLTLVIAIGLKAIGDRYFAYPLYFAAGISAAQHSEFFERAASKMKLLRTVAAMIALHLSYAFVAAVGEPKPAWVLGYFDLFAVLFLFVGGAIFVKVAFDPPARLQSFAVLDLGRVSYSFYLWHLLVLIVAFRIIHYMGWVTALQTWPWIVRWSALFIVCAIASVLVSRVSYRLFERPYFAARDNQRPTQLP